MMITGAVMQNLVACEDDNDNHIEIINKNVCKNQTLLVSTTSRLCLDAECPPSSMLSYE